MSNRLLAVSSWPMHSHAKEGTTEGDLAFSCLLHLSPLLDLHPKALLYGFGGCSAQQRLFSNEVRLGVFELMGGGKLSLWSGQQQRRES